jgi:hypothetical protein
VVAKFGNAKDAEAHAVELMRTISRASRELAALRKKWRPLPKNINAEANISHLKPTVLISQSQGNPSMNQLTTSIENDVQEIRNTNTRIGEMLLSNLDQENNVLSNNRELINQLMGGGQNSCNSAMCN